ncbi:MAG: T9SS type A sorting domain-containing protein [Sedimentisphaerales bacterium]
MKKYIFYPAFSCFLLLSNIYAQNATVINLDSTHQVIRGFGAANILPWRPDMTTEEINTAFGTEDGQIGFSILRLRVPYQQSEFNLNVPTAQLAHTLGVTLIASPWSPPPEMKSNNNIVGGELEEDYYDDFAAHLDSFADYMAENDAPIYAISVQNEPDVSVTYESCDWNASQMVKFIKENAPSIGVKVMAPESYHFDKALSDPILNDSAACANLDIVAGHIYGGGLAPYPLAESKGKELWMTEHLSGQYNSGNDWSWAFNVALEINDVMNAGMSAYIWWYIVRYYGPISDGTMDSGDKGNVTKKGYVMSQFARFIRPGYLRVECDGNPQSDVFASAYKDSTSSKVVIVAINTSSQAKNQTFTFQNGDVEKVRPYVTSETKNCSRETSILVTNDSLNVTLEGESITTFVSGDDAIVIVESPASFKLFQNYPNPFYSSTQIDFEIPEKSFVSLKVYNLLGQEIDELAGKEYSAGVHSAIFDASHLANGIYFYTLRARDFIETKKMFFIR